MAGTRSFYDAVARIKTFNGDAVVGFTHDTFYPLVGEDCNYSNPTNQKARS